MTREYVITEGLMRRLFTYEITAEELLRMIDDPMETEVEDFHPGWEDIEKLLSNIEKKDPKVGELWSEWGIIFSEADDEYDDGGFIDGDGPDGEDTGTSRLMQSCIRAGWFCIPVAEHIVWHAPGEKEKYGQSPDFLGVESPGAGKYRIVSAIAELTGDPEYHSLHAGSSGVMDFGRIRNDIGRMKAEKWDEDIREWKWTDRNKFEALEHPEGYGFGGPMIKPEDLPEAREILNELCDRDIPRALDRRCYAAYGGSYLWDCDWETSRKSLMRLMELDTVSDHHKCVYANTLGYICYYGRCSDNVPDYPEALKWFTMGAAGGVYESVYKLADMFHGGKGVPENQYAALNMLLWAYRHTMSDFLHGRNEGDSDFSDAALRVGTILREQGEVREAMRVLLQADYAVHERMKSGNCYGDDHVAMAIRKEISEARHDLPRTGIPDAPGFPLMEIIDSFMSEPGPARGEVGEMEDGSVELAVIAHYNDQKAFITIPEAGYCTVSNVVHYVFEGLSDFHVRNNAKDFIFDQYILDTESDENRIKIRFMRDGKEMCRVDTSKIGVLLPEDENMIVPGGEEHQIASCSFTEDGRTYDYLCDGAAVEAGDKAIVDTWNGETEVFVRKVYMMSESELPIPLEKYKSLVKVLAIR